MKQFNNLMSCLPWSILISPEITDARIAAQWYPAPFSDVKKNFGQKRGFAGKKEGRIDAGYGQQGKNPCFYPILHRMIHGGFLFVSRDDERALVDRQTQNTFRRQILVLSLNDYSAQTFN